MPIEGRFYSLYPEVKWIKIGKKPFMSVLPTNLKLCVQETEMLKNLGAPELYLTSKMYKYLDLIKSGTEYARKMNRLSRRIFGDVVRETSKPSMRVVQRMSEKPFYEQDDVVNYYPRHVETYILMRKLRFYGLYRDEHMDFKEEMARLRKLRGKGPPKKGEGRQKMRGK